MSAGNAVKIEGTKKETDTNINFDKQLNGRQKIKMLMTHSVLSKN